MKNDADSCGVVNCGENDERTSDPNDTPSRGDHERLEAEVLRKVELEWPLGSKGKCDDTVVPIRVKEEVVVNSLPD